ncbi:hypothetical protein M427DRAFT_61246 [Gonapodya prolifera JEL478]|uniref:CRAL-TRIO domain-containing protein n=1 Tax=Gonapodya prolifera (strain JEL478) TaxID=1344416 RepID=A0A139A3H8_GONPJ|nr:hypothetical protein M427DRAFT_61246 [Gonapodya prolifera JEL478]|eukprot:KXS11035.1 hypothetical protein M427DRAFT_61246 [Gonapodya prolifera JEL478]
MQVRGVTVMNNARGMSLGLVWKMWTHFAKARTMSDGFEGQIPIRVSAYVMVNEPVFFDVVWRIVSSVMKKKLSLRVFLLGKERISVLRTLFGPTARKDGAPPTSVDESFLDRLPIDLGGKLDVDAWARAGQGLRLD